MIRTAFYAASLAVGVSVLAGCNPANQAVKPEKGSQARFESATKQLDKARQHLEQLSLDLAYQKQFGAQDLEPDDDSLSRQQIYNAQESLLAEAKATLDNYPSVINIAHCNYLRMRVAHPPSSLMPEEMPDLLSPQILSDARDMADALTDLEEEFLSLNNSADAGERKKAQEMLPEFEQKIADLVSQTMPPPSQTEREASSKVQTTGSRHARGLDKSTPRSPLDEKLLPIQIRLNHEFSEIVQWNLLTQHNMNQCSRALALYGVIPPVSNTAPPGRS